MITGLLLNAIALLLIGPLPIYGFEPSVKMIIEKTARLCFIIINVISEQIGKD